MKKVLKVCAFCNKSFDLKSNKHRIALEFRDKSSNLKKEYFCCKACFSDYVKKNV
ncbi:MAG: hypothetical protein GON13_00755 [Nanoarchaeota archaeon]|nr:hypothetical protein [Nanoarchaeota archaeon]